MSGGIYRELAHQKPATGRLGGMFFSLVQPGAGFERAFNRWYEGDHLYPAALAAPWVFSGRRWVATRELKAARLVGAPDQDPPLSAGSIIATYFMTEGHVGDAREWMMTMLNDTLVPEGRLFAQRERITGGFYDFRDGLVMDPEPMTHEVALDHPYGALVVELIDAADPASLADLIEWIRDVLIPQTTDRGQCIIYTPTEPDEVARKWVPDANPYHVCLTWLLPAWSAEEWSAGFGDHEAKIRDTGLGNLAMAAPFLPLVPGTNRYIDDI